MVTVDSLKRVTARFRPADRTVFASLTGTGLGMVTSRPSGLRCPGGCQGDFPEGTGLSLLAHPAPGSRFAGWRDDCSGRTCELVVDSEKFVSAAFVDVRAPRVRALPTTGTRGGFTRLRYRVNENTGVARVTIRVGRRSVRTRFRRLAATRTYSARWRIARSASLGA